MTRKAHQPLALALATAGANLGLGLSTLAWGIRAQLPLAWGFGLVCLLHAGPSLAVAHRIRGGLGNRGLEAERRALRATAHLTRLSALGLGIAAVLSWTEAPWVALDRIHLVLAATALLAWVWLWRAKRPFSALHPSLAQDARRTCDLGGMAALLLAGCLLAPLHPWVAPASAAGLALWAFWAGQGLARDTGLTLSACGGGCGGCG